MENLAFLLKEIFQEKHLLLWKISSFWVGKMEHVKTEIFQSSDASCQFSGRLHLCVELHFSFLWSLTCLYRRETCLIIKSTHPHLPTFLSNHHAHR